MGKKDPMRLRERREREGGREKETDTHTDKYTHKGR